jgi:hypothetical protein
VLKGKGGGIDKDLPYPVQSLTVELLGNQQDLLRNQLGRHSP